MVAWLVVNSLRSEQTQWTMLCLQNISNLFRKNAFKCLLQNTSYFAEGGKNGSTNGRTSQALLPWSGLTPVSTPASTAAANANAAAATAAAAATTGVETEAEVSISGGGGGGAASEECTGLVSDATVDLYSPPISDDDVFISALNADASLRVFDEAIDFGLVAGVPDPMPFDLKLRALLEDNDAFLLPAQHIIGHETMVMVGQFAMLEGAPNRQDAQN